MKRKFLLPFLIVATIFTSKINAQIITTLTGGSGIAGFSGDGGAQFSATLNTPGGIFVDRIGNIYIADDGNYRIRKVDKFGIITTVAGNGGSGYSGDGGLATDAQLQPFSVFVDGAGNIYFGDVHNNVVREINDAGVINTIAGNGTAGYTGDGGLATAALVDAPSGVVVDTAGNVYFSDATYRLRKINASGIISTFCGTGVLGFSGDGGPATAAMISTPGYMHIDNATYTLYFEDNNNNRIRKIDLATGIINTVAGNGGGGYSGDGGPATSAELHAPGGITLDSAGNLYIADDVNYRVRIVNPAGIISTYAGSGIAGFSGDGGAAIAARVNVAIDVAIDLSGHLLIADNHNNRIRIIDNPCSGTPYGGVVVATPSTSCALPFIATMSVDSLTVTPGVTYYWQSSLDSVTWTNISGAIGISCIANVTTSPMYFRFIDSCTVSEEPGYAKGVKLGLSAASAGIISGTNGVCIGSEITLTDTLAGGSWSAYNGAATVSDSGVVHGVTAGLDIISYTVTNGCGTFSATYPVTIYTTHQCDSVLGVNTLSNNIDNIKVYPNPTANGSFTIETPENEQVSILIFDMVGQVVQTEFFGSNSPSKKVLNLRNCSPGTYFIKAVCTDKTYYDKIVLLH